jgi:hypothetical protein
LRLQKINETYDKLSSCRLLHHCRYTKSNVEINNNEREEK